MHKMAVPVFVNYGRCFLGKICINYTIFAGFCQVVSCKWSKRVGHLSQIRKSVLHDLPVVGVLSADDEVAAVGIADEVPALVKLLLP